MQVLYFWKNCWQKFTDMHTRWAAAWLHDLHGVLVTIRLWLWCLWCGRRSPDGGGSTPGSVHEAGDIPPLRSTKLRHSAATESESECRDSGFNEGPPYPDVSDASHVYSDFDGQSYRSRHYSEDSRLSYAPEDYPHGKYYITEERMFNYATTFMPNYEQRRLRRNRYNYLDDYDNYQDFPESDKYYDTSSLSREHSDSFIYVSYPPDVKKRFNENRWWKNCEFYLFLYLEWHYLGEGMPVGQKS